MAPKKNNKVAIINDTHFGMRKGSQIFHDYFETFYRDTFFPAIDEQGVDTIIHMGDVFDVRKNIDYWSLDWAKRVFFDPCRDRGIKLHIIVGNHDIWYKSSLKINSPSLNLREYTNIKIYSEPQTAKIKGVDAFVIPWICEENAEQFVHERDASKAKLAFGHLEVAGFYANATYQVQHGLGMEEFGQFEQVFSGHYHKRSRSGNVAYLGNPYHMFWNDVGEDRGFTIFDMKTREEEWVKNPKRMFHKIYYNEEDQRLINPNRYKDTYLKVIVEGKSTPRKLATFIDKFYKVGIHDLKVIENFEVNLDGDENIESEDTLTTLTKYVNAMDDVDKESLIGIFKSLYVEAQEI